MSTETVSPTAPALFPDSTDAQRPLVVIGPSSGWRALGLAELWRYRELVFFLTWRDIKVRYKQTALGAAWAVIQPLVTMIVFTLIFGRVAHLPSDGVPYPVFAFAALLPWTYFAYVLQQAGTSVLTNANMISKVYFPRLVLPLSTVAAGLVDFAIAFAVFVLMMFVFHVAPTARLAALPLFLMLAIITAVGVGLWLSALSVAYRDVKYAIPFLVQVWLYASPVAYTAHLVTGKVAMLYAFNPMAGVIQGFRWSLLGTAGGPDVYMLPSVVVSLVLLATGLYYFKRVERTFADIV